ncbi:competence/damage-inducible protein A [Nocardioides acrostichi]|uniref:CinA-like protein n=1 Tax=Nocardioides acrostichi TaxID=2784339 RepID=A0A930V4M6_9ACTN|nr:competence/damage-inducible protein A [Nocardioides acrostichi]MBF4163757.1 competence/damage-inducible protein A [Nocardioides acrostichi]
MTARAGIVVTGTEVLTGRVADANGPWLAEALRGRGVDVGRVVVVGDRPDDLAAAVGFLAGEGGHDLVITTGGLGPTADDLTARVVAQVQGRALRLDEGLRALIDDIVRRIADERGWQGPLGDALDEGTRKQALVPDGATWLHPTGTAPGLVVPPTGAGAPVVVLPGPPGELRAMWDAVLVDPVVTSALAGAEPLEQRTLRMWGPPEAELAVVLREHGEQHSMAGLEVTTCLRGGELEVVTRYSPAAAGAYADLEATLLERFADTLVSADGRSVDEVVADALRAGGLTVATAESCTAGLLAGRFADRPGSSAYLLGGLVTYSNEAKTALLDVPAALIERVGAVSEEVALAMAAGARARLGADLGFGVTGVAGPDGGTADKPVGLVHVALVGTLPDGTAVSEHRRLRLPGDRMSVRARTVTTCLHLLRGVLTSRS